MPLEDDTPMILSSGSQITATNLDTGEVVEMGKAFFSLSTASKEWVHAFEKLSSVYSKTVEMNFAPSEDTTAAMIEMFENIGYEWSGTDDNGNSLPTLSRSLPAMSVVVETPPCTCEKSNDSLRNLIIHLNDKHRWTREEIADWIDLWAIENNVDISF